MMYLNRPVVVAEGCPWSVWSVILRNSKLELFDWLRSLTRVSAKSFSMVLHTHGRGSLVVGLCKFSYFLTCKIIAPLAFSSSYCFGAALLKDR